MTVAIALVARGCRREPGAGGADAAVAAAHGDHRPHHGGGVLMDADGRHLELVVDAATGRLELWFSDGARTPLPASVATAVTVVVTPPGAEPQTLTLARDAMDRRWSARGRGAPWPAETRARLEVDGMQQRGRFSVELSLAELLALGAAGAEAGSHVP